MVVFVISTAGLQGWGGFADSVKLIERLLKELFLSNFVPWAFRAKGPEGRAGSGAQGPIRCSLFWREKSTSGHGIVKMRPGDTLRNWHPCVTCVLNIRLNRLMICQRLYIAHKNMTPSPIFCPAAMIKNLSRLSLAFLHVP